MRRSNETTKRTRDLYDGRRECSTRSSAPLSSARLSRALTLALAVCAFVVANVCAASAERLRFRVQLSPELAAQPASGRLLVFMTQSAPAQGDVLGVDFMNPRSVFVTGLEVRNLVAGKSVEVDPDALSFPAPFSQAPAGDYRVMALLDADHSYTYDNETSAGDLLSAVATIKNLNPASSPVVELTLTRRVPEEAVAETENGKLVTFESPSLTAFWGRPVQMQAAVVLPPSYAKNTTARYPAVYHVHGYGGGILNQLRQAPQFAKAMADGRYPEMIHVFLNAHTTLGHHVFADSVNNGPWGHALTAEFIPYLESKFRADGAPAGRFLTGHSSGGWSTLWLQITYPDFFGGTWSTSPDPVDFHNFTGPDLTRAPRQNFYRRADGTPYNLVRAQGREIMTVEEYTRLEQVEGYYGGQMASFEAVFSPRGADGQPMQLFDRETGRIDPAVAKAWERYDIARVLRDNWATLGPKLRGKLHIVVGTADTFHLDEGVRLLQATLKSLGGDAQIEFLEGRDHFNLYEGGLADRFAREMYAVARPRGGGAVTH